MNEKSIVMIYVIRIIQWRNAMIYIIKIIQRVLKTMLKEQRKFLHVKLAQMIIQ